MRTLIMVLMLVVQIAGLTTSAIAVNCYTDSIVRNWLQERDAAAKSLVRAWARGAPTEKIAPDIAVVIANEIYIGSTCRNSQDFLREKLLTPILGPNAKVEMLPAFLLERFIGHDLLSPRVQFPEITDKEGKKR